MSVLFPLKRIKLELFCSVILLSNNRRRTNSEGEYQRKTCNQEYYRYEIKSLPRESEVGPLHNSVITIIVVVKKWQCIGTVRYNNVLHSIYIQ